MPYNAPEREDGDLRPDELEAESAADLPERVVLSLIGTSAVTGAPVPISATDGTSPQAPPPEPVGTVSDPPPITVADAPPPEPSPMQQPG
jgi:hypothetical protein